MRNKFIKLLVGISVVSLSSGVMSAGNASGIFPVRDTSSRPVTASNTASNLGERWFAWRSGNSAAVCDRDESSNHGVSTERAAMAAHDAPQNSASVWSRLRSKQGGITIALLGSGVLICFMSGFLGGLLIIGGAIYGMATVFRPEMAAFFARLKQQKMAAQASQDPMLTV